MRLIKNDKRITHSSGFTLIELSIVLVIIGLIIGGILAGQNLIDAAAQRAQIAQIEKYNTAVHTFQNKYGFLPGDIPNPYATKFGFVARGSGGGQGNGDGIISGVDGGSHNWGNLEGAGEMVVLWEDLSTAGLVDGTFSTASETTLAGADVTGAAIGNYFPPAKIGQNNYIFVWAGGSYNSGSYIFSGINYWEVEAVTNIRSNTNAGKVATNMGLSVQQAYNIDKKVDDGLPQLGNAMAVFVGDYNSGTQGDPFYTDGTDLLYSGPNNSAVAGSSTTCMDNSGNGGIKHYSIQQNGGGGMNCALSIRFQ